VCSLLIQLSLSFPFPFDRVLPPASGSGARKKHTAQVVIYIPSPNRGQNVAHTQQTRSMSGAAFTFDVMVRATTAMFHTTQQKMKQKTQQH
jgi:hypothetical protein